MSRFDVRVRVWLKPSVFDPQGNAVEKALASLGYDGVERVRIGKYMELSVEAASEAEADAQVKEICGRVLCNPVMETYAYELVPAAAGAGGAGQAGGAGDTAAGAAPPAGALAAGARAPGAGTADADDRAVRS